MRRWFAPAVLVALLAVSAFADRLIKGSSSRVYVQDGGSIYAIPDAKTFECLGYQWPKIVSVPDSEISKLNLRGTLPSLEDGKLVKGTDPRVYLVSGCTRRWIPDAETFEKMGLSWGAIQSMPDWALKQVKEGPAYESTVTVEGKGSDVSDKYKKTECVFSRPHMVLDNRVGRDVRFRVTGGREEKLEGRCNNVQRSGETTTIEVPKGNECKFVMAKGDGDGITKVEVLDGKTNYVQGNWPIFGCCRHTGARSDVDMSEQGGWQAALNDAIHTGKYNGTAWRAYKAVYSNQGLKVMSRDKDSNIPLSARTGWESLDYTAGTCREGN